MVGGPEFSLAFIYHSRFRSSSKVQIMSQNIFARTGTEMEQKTEGTRLDRLSGLGYFRITSVRILLLNKEF
jgi:hypothetical protein